MAVAEGFEPSDGGYPSHAFEACSLGRSDTPPCGSLPGTWHGPLIAIEREAGAKKPPRIRTGVTFGGADAALVQSLPREERRQRRGTLLGEHSPAYLGPVREPPIADHVPQ